MESSTGVLCCMQVPLTPLHSCSTPIRSRVNNVGLRYAALIAIGPLSTLRTQWSQLQACP